VYEGYTPGYLGTEVCPDNVVVYGTGWSYPPYIGNDWVGGPCTYGFGAGFADNWDVGFGFGFSDGLWLGSWAQPWWGPYRWGSHHHYDYDHVSLNHVNIYHHWDHGISHTDHGYGRNEWNGHEWSSHWGTHFNPYSSRGIEHGNPLIVHGGTGGVRPAMEGNPRPAISSHAPEVSAPRINAYDGNFHAQRPASPAARTAPSAHVTTLAPGLGYNQDLYGSRDGSVYRQNPSAGWQHNTGSTWQSVPHDESPALQQHAFSHNMGEQRFNNYRSYGGGFSHPSGGFVHSGGGGGHR
jgi:hypothetical protein